MTDWLYGDSGDRFPVRHGDILAVGDRHILACGDIEADNGLTLAREYGPPAIAYTDLPYNESVAKSYRTKAGLDNDVRYDRFLNAVAWTLSMTAGEVFVETGIESARPTKKALEKAGARVSYIYNITYYGENPAALVHGSFDGAPNPVPALQGADDAETPRIAIEAASDPGDIVMDICMGRGLTAVAAHETGRQSLGLELHPRRLAVSIEKLVDRIYDAGNGGPRPDALVSRLGVFPGYSEGESERE